MKERRSAVKFNRSSVTVGLVVGVLAGGAGGALAATSGSSTTSTSTSAQSASAPNWGRGFVAARGIGNCGPAFKAAASYLGMSQSALHTQLEKGMTLARVATARGKSVSGLENAITTAFASSVNADGDLTATEKSAIIEGEKSRVDAFVHSNCDGRFDANRF
jgi:hypothetical protein